MLFALVTSQMLGSLFCCSLNIVPTILSFQPSAISSALPWLTQTSVWRVSLFSRQACSFNPTLFYKRMRQPDHEVRTGSVKNMLKKAFFLKQWKVKLLILVTEMLDIKANKYLAVYKIPETHRPQLCSWPLENDFHKCSAMLCVTWVSPFPFIVFLCAIQICKSFQETFY